MNLKQARNEFDRVLVTHIRTETGAKTTVILVEGLNMYVGVSKCAPNDNFNRKLGVTIALGRATFEQRLRAGETTARKSHATRTESLSYTQTFGDVIKLDESVLTYLPKKNTAS